MANSMTYQQFHQKMKTTISPPPTDTEIRDVAEALGIITDIQVSNFGVGSKVFVDTSQGMVYILPHNEDTVNAEYHNILHPYWASHFETNAVYLTDDEARALVKSIEQGLAIYETRQGC